MMDWPHRALPLIMASTASNFRCSSASLNMYSVVSTWQAQPGHMRSAGSRALVPPLSTSSNVCLIPHLTHASRQQARAVDANSSSNEAHVKLSMNGPPSACCTDTDVTGSSDCSITTAFTLAEHEQVLVCASMRHASPSSEVIKSQSPHMTEAGHYCLALKPEPKSHLDLAVLGPGKNSSPQKTSDDKMHLSLPKLLAEDLMFQASVWATEDLECETSPSKSRLPSTVLTLIWRCLPSRSRQNSTSPETLVMWTTQCICHLWRILLSISPTGAQTGQQTPRTVTVEPQNPL